MFCQKQTKKLKFNFTIQVQVFRCSAKKILSIKNAFSLILWYNTWDPVSTMLMSYLCYSDTFNVSMYCLLQLSLHQVWIISNKKTIIPYNEYHCYIQRSITVLEKCCSNLYWAFFQYHHTNFSKAYKLCLTLCHSHYPVLVRILTTIAHLMDYPPPTLDLDNF